MPANVVPSRTESSRLGRQVFHSGMITLVARVYGILLVFGLNSYLARHMSPEQYGMFTLAITTATFVSMLCVGGLDQSALRFISGDARNATKTELRELLLQFGRLFGISLVAWTLACFVILISPIARSLRFSLTTTLLIAGCASAISVHRMASDLLRSLHAMRFAAFFDGRTGGAVSNSLLLLTAFAFGTSLTGDRVLVITIISLAMATPVALYLLHQIWSSTSPDSPGPAYAAIPQKEIFAYAIPLLITQVMTFLTTQSDIWLVGSWGSEHDTAMYGSARRLVILTATPLQIVNLATASLIARIAAEGDRTQLQTMLRSTAGLAVIPATIVLVPMIAAPQQVLAAVFGAPYAGAGSILAILALGQFANVVSGSCGLTLMLGGFARTVLVVQTVCAGLFLIGGVYGLSRYGLSGLAISASIVTTAQFTTLWLLARWKMKVWTHPTLNPIAFFRHPPN